MRHSYKGYTRCPHPSENWGEGTNKARWGLFRWGYQFIPIPASEILHYGYTARPADASINLRSKRLHFDRHPDISLAKLKTVALDELVKELEEVWDDLSGKLEINPKAINALPEDLQYLISEDPEKLKSYLASARLGSFWVQTRYCFARPFNKWYYLPSVLLVSGWNKTSVHPYDLGGTEIKCRCVCHFGCSTMKHNQPILRRSEYKGWRREGNERYAYFTTALAFNFSANFFLYHILTFNKHSAFSPWRELLNYAVRMTNMDLDKCRAGFHII